jgi:mercuric reductase
LVVQLNEGCEHVVAFDRCLIATGANPRFRRFRPEGHAVLDFHRGAGQRHASERLAVIGSSVVAVSWRRRSPGWAARSRSWRAARCSSAKTRPSARPSRRRSAWKASRCWTTQASQVAYENGEFVLTTEHGNIAPTNCWSPPDARPTRAAWHWTRQA